MRNAVQLFALILMAAPVAAQQVADAAFRFENPHPAYEPGAGPQVCIDQAHHNFHTAEGRYKPFAELLRGDGYRVTGFQSAFSRETLSGCEVLVIANALSEANSHGEREWAPTDWGFPHPSAFTREEINELAIWIREGGSLFLIVDHAPWPGAASDLAAILGVHPIDGEATASADARSGSVLFGAIHEEGWQQAAKVYEIPYERFRPIQRNAGTLAPHPIVKGRTREEEVDAVVTFTGHAFYPSVKVQPILVFGPKAVGRIPLEWNLEKVSQEDWPQFSVGGWLQGGALHLGEGRVVILGEAAMCTAQVAGPKRMPMGMNAPHAFQNAQFCLNVVHWLSGLLDRE